MILPDGSGSWVIVRKSDGRAVLETFDAKIAAAINRAAYGVLTAREYLSQLNASIRKVGR